MTLERVFTDEQLLAIISKALKVRDWETVRSAMTVLALQAPGQAAEIMDAIQARRAELDDDAES